MLQIIRRMSLCTIHNVHLYHGSILFDESPLEYV